MYGSKVACIEVAQQCSLIKKPCPQTAAYQCVL